MNANQTKDPIVTLQRVIRVAERTAVTVSVMLLLGTVSYLTIYTWV